MASLDPDGDGTTGRSSKPILNGWRNGVQLRAPADVLPLLGRPEGPVSHGGEHAARNRPGGEWGRQYGVHVCLNFHRAPGYSVSQALLAEPWNLWTDQHAVDIFRFYWGHFAERYRGIPSRRLSFNPINEPSHCSAGQYEKVIRAGVDAIRQADPAAWF